MVLLMRVSIPLWFSRNRFDKAFRFEVIRFHTTMVLTQPGGKGKLPGKEGVSIPLWFSRNRHIIRSLYCSCFHTTMVLTQHGPPQNGSYSC